MRIVSLVGNRPQFVKAAPLCTALRAFGDEVLVHSGQHYDPELSQVFYDELSRVLRRKGKLFHYTGTPNKLTSGRDVPNEVRRRLRRAGLAAELNGDGVLPVKR